MKKVTLVSISLMVDSRWAVGGVPNVAEEVDLPVLRDPREPSSHGIRPVVPGTSLAGSLRRHLGEPLATEWLGSPPGGREVRTGKKALVAGRLTLLGAAVDDDVTVESRGTTAVNGERAAAAGRTLRIEQWATPGQLTVFAEHEGARSAPLMARALSWQPVIGRGRSTGLGQARVTGTRTLTLDLTDDDQLTYWLGDRASWYAGGAGPEGAATALEAPDHDQKPTSYLLPVLNVVWTVHEAVHVGVDKPQPDVDDRTTAMAMRVRGQFVIPGSSWKGLFRHRVQFILRHVGASKDDTGEVLDVLFGSAERRGVLTFHDSYAAPETTAVRRSHAPIDRFTGGALDGGLHRVEAIPVGTTMELSIEGERKMPPSVHTVLGHAVRDVHDGLVRVGKGGSRGYGWLLASYTGSTEPLGPVDVTSVVTDVRQMAAVATQEGER